MAQVLEELAVEAQSALERGRAEAGSLHPLETKLLEGDPLHCLLAEISRREATAVVVGSHGISRATGIALGAVSTYLLHEAPCSVLIARGSIDAERWPRRIVVGVDGSADSARAVEAATALAARFDANCAPSWRPRTPASISMLHGGSRRDARSTTQRPSTSSRLPPRPPT